MSSNGGKRSAYSKFEYAISSEETRISYHRRLRFFLDFLEIPSTPLSEGANILYEQIQQNGNQWFSDCLVEFIIYLKGRMVKKEIVASTLRNYYKPIKLFCDMNDILLNWKMISRGMPSSRSAAQDRAPTLSEIHKLLEFPGDERIKPIVLTMVSSGIRLGAWTYLKWKHVIPIYSDTDGVTVMAAKLIVYSGEPEQYFTFMTPEAYNALKSWMDYRQSSGENVTGDSWLMRYKWSTSDVHWKGGRASDAKYNKQLSAKGIRSLFDHAYFKQGIRPPPPTTIDMKASRQFRHEFKALHGFRKYFKTVCETGGMKPANIELLMGHDLGLSQSYYKPTESQLLEDYLKVVNALTIDKAFKLQKQLLETKKENELYRNTIQQMNNRMGDIERLLNSKSFKDL